MLIPDDLTMFCPACSYAAQPAIVHALNDSAQRRAVDRLPADVAADNDVASEDDVVGYPLVDGVRDHRRRHGELYRAGVDDTDNVAGPGSLQDAEERPVAAVLSVELDDLFVISEARNTTDKMQHRNNHAVK